VRLIGAIHVGPAAVLEVQYVHMRGVLPPGASGEAFVQQGLQIKAAATTATNVIASDAARLELGLYYVRQPATPGSASSVPSGQWSLCNTIIYWEASSGAATVPLAAIVAPVAVGCALLSVVAAFFVVYRRRRREQGGKGPGYEKAGGGRRALELHACWGAARPGPCAFTGRLGTHPGRRPLELAWPGVTGASRGACRRPH
jgi:hypothetical protein